MSVTDGNLTTDGAQQTVRIAGTVQTSSSGGSSTVTANQGTPAAVANAWPIKIVDAAGVNVANVAPSGGIKVFQDTGPTATLANVASSITNITLFASNGLARMRFIFNDSTANLFVKFGATASAASFTVKIAAGGQFAFPVPLYTGIVDGIWDAANGNARVTEY